MQIIPGIRDTILTRTEDSQPCIEVSQLPSADLCCPPYTVLFKMYPGPISPKAL